MVKEHTEEGLADKKSKNTNFLNKSKHIKVAQCNEPNIIELEFKNKGKNLNVTTLFLETSIPILMLSQGVCTGRNERPRTNGVCSYGAKPGHEQENCFQMIGFPD